MIIRSGYTFLMGSTTNFAQAVDVAPALAQTPGMVIEG